MILMKKYWQRLNDARQGRDDMASFLSVLTEDECFNFEERAAIMEFDGGLTRAEAEKQARICLSQKGR